MSQGRRLVFSFQQGKVEAMRLLEHRELAGQGIGWVDTHLLANATVEAGTTLWTRNKRLANVADKPGLL